MERSAQDRRSRQSAHWPNCVLLAQGARAKGPSTIRINSPAVISAPHDIVIAQFHKNSFKEFVGNVLGSGDMGGQGPLLGMVLFGQVNTGSQGVLRPTRQHLDRST
jgi:hypothetical protein